MVHRARERRVHRELQRLEPVAVQARVEQALERVVVGERVGRRAEHRAHGLGGRLLGARHVVDEQRDARAEAARRAAPPRRRRPRSRRGSRVSTISCSSSGPCPMRSKKAGSTCFTSADHRLDHGARLAGRVARAHHPVQPVEHDARERVHHGGERRHRDHVARRLDRLLLGLALDLLAPLVRGVRRQVPQPRQDLERVGLQQRRELAVALPGRLDRAPRRRGAPRQPALSGTSARTSSRRTKRCEDCSEL